MTVSKKVLLIGPQSRKEDAERSFMAPALGVVRMAGFLNAKGHQATSIDPNLHMLTGKGPSLTETLSGTEWDFIGFSVLEETLIKDIENMNLARWLCPGAVLVAGGIEAQFNYQTVLDKSPCSYVILSEGEVPLLQLVNGDPIHEIPGIVFKSKAQPLSQELFNEATNLIEWEKNPYEDYWDYYLAKYGDSATEENLKEIHTVRVFSRNRCPIGCKFCSSTNQITWGSGAAVPVISATEDNLVETVQRIKDAHPRVRTIYLTDDDFCINKRSVVRFCQQVTERDFGDLTFMCFARASDLTEEVCEWMKKANFRRLNVGIESFSEKVLDEMGKRCDVEENHKALRMLKRHGIKVFMNIILVTPQTTLEDMETTIDQALVYVRDSFYHAGITLAIKPLKGTDFYEMYSDYLSAVEPIPGTPYFIQRDDMILAEDPRVKAVQLKYWYTIDDVIKQRIEQDRIAHAVASNLSLIKLEYMRSLVIEAKTNGAKLAKESADLEQRFHDSRDTEQMPFYERQTVDVEIPEAIGGIAHPSSKREKSTHGSF